MNEGKEEDEVKESIAETNGRDGEKRGKNKKEIREMKEHKKGKTDFEKRKRKTKKKRVGLIWEGRMERRNKKIE